LLCGYCSHLLPVGVFPESNKKKTARKTISKKKYTKKSISKKKANQKKVNKTETSKKKVSAKKIAIGRPAVMIIGGAIRIKLR